MNQKDTILYTEYSSSMLYTIMYNATQSGTFVGYIRGRLCSTLADFFREVSSSMRFPYYFGWNWAAFDECITDLEWLKFSSLLIVVENYDALFKDEDLEEEYKKLVIKYLNIAIEYWHNQNISFIVYLNS